MASIKEKSDQELLGLLKAGHKVALTEIYARYAKVLLKFTAYKLNDLSDAEDIIHDIFLNLWLSRETNTIASNLQAYLFSITRNKITDLYRKRLHQEEYLKAITYLAENQSPSVDQLYHSKELQDKINIHLAELNPRTKQIYELSRNDNQSIPEIAVKLNLSEQTVKNQITIALKHLKGKLSALIIIISILVHL